MNFRLSALSALVLVITAIQVVAAPPPGLEKSTVDPTWQHAMDLPHNTRVQWILEAHQHCPKNDPNKPVPLCVMTYLREKTAEHVSQQENRSVFSKAVHGIKSVFKKQTDK